MILPKAAIQKELLNQKKEQELLIFQENIATKERVSMIFLVKVFLSPSVWPFKFSLMTKNYAEHFVNTVG